MKIVFTSISNFYLFIYIYIRQGLVRGEVEIIHPILTWLLTHIDVVKKRAYLSRFLVKVRSRLFREREKRKLT